MEVFGYANCGMRSDGLIGNHVIIIGRGLLFKTVFRHLPGGTEQPSKHFMQDYIYLFRIRALISRYQTNTDKCTRILPRHHFVNNICQSNMFQPLKGHLLGVYLINSSSNFNEPVRVETCCNDVQT